MEDVLFLERGKLFKYFLMNKNYFWRINEWIEWHKYSYGNKENWVKMWEKKVNIFEKKMNLSVGVCLKSIVSIFNTDHSIS